MIPFLCFLCFDHDLGWESIIKFIPLGLGMMFHWGTFGSVFPVGLVTAGTIVFCTYAFIQDWNAKRCVYWLTLASIIHFAPVYDLQYGMSGRGGHDEAFGDWLAIGRPFLVIVLFSGCYALLPRLINAIGRRLES
jgi:hypothetical protein